MNLNASHTLVDSKTSHSGVIIATLKRPGEIKTGTFLGKAANPFRMNSKIALAESEREILDCYPIMVELRPHIRRDEFVSTVKRLAEIADYQLAYLADGGIKAVAGFRISEWLASGKYLEIEDLVATSAERSRGYGGELFDWLVKHAEENGCNQIRLVSRVTRADAHRFYLNKRMTIEAYYFSLQLK